MAAPCYITWSGITPTVSLAQSAVVSNNSITTPRTILQLATGKKIRVVEWGYLLSQAPTAPFQAELIDTGTGTGATITQGSVLNYNDTGASTSSALVASVTQTGYNASGEGTVGTVRLLAQTFDLSTYFKQQFPLGREPEVAASCFLRIRVTPTTTNAVNIIAYCIWEE